MPPTQQQRPQERAAPHPTAPRLFFAFSRIGLTSFGGGLSGWLLREFVHDRHWLSEEEFLNGLAISQALPGINVTNMAIWIGYRLRGRLGAIAGFAGIVLPPAIVIVLIGMLFTVLTRYPLTHLALDGAAAAAIGLSFSMGITAARRLPPGIIPIIVLVATFFVIGILHWPMVWVLLVAGLLSVAIEYAKLARA